MQIREVMSRSVILASPKQTIGEVAQMMAARDIGFMPVGDQDRIVGMVTDRDIVVRGLARDVDPKTGKLSDVMSGHVRTARQDDDVNEVLTEMANAQIRRMPVVDGQD